MGRFDGQVAIVVGGGSDVGLGVAMRMGREGASIVLVEADRVMGERAADMLDAEGIEGRLLLGNPADSAAAKWAMTTAKLVWGRVDVVVYADPMGRTFPALSMRSVRRYSIPCTGTTCAGRSSIARP